MRRKVILNLKPRLNQGPRSSWNSPGRQEYMRPICDRPFSRGYIYHIKRNAWNFHNKSNFVQGSKNIIISTCNQYQHLSLQKATNELFFIDFSTLGL